jgi:hypothetical protein
MGGCGPEGLMNFEAEWLPPWAPVDDPASRAALEAELIRELSAEHVLSGVQFRLVGRHTGRDDFLFELEDGRFAQVHLTWSKETRPLWPATDVYETWAEWVRDSMIPDHQG